MNRKNFVKSLSLIVSILVLIGLAVLYFVFKRNILLSLIIAVIFIGVLLVIYFSIDVMQIENNKQIEASVDAATRVALNIGRVGLLVYSDDNEITWMSDLFTRNHMNHVGEKLLNWIPELQTILQGEQDSTTVVIEDEKYKITKISNSSILIFEDITKEYDLDKKLNEDGYVLGSVIYDNYDEVSESEDDVAYVNTYIKNPVIDYFKKFGCVYKTLKNNRLFLVLNEKIYSQIYDDRFSILKQIRKVSKEANLDVTLSIAFVRGSDDLAELDNEAQNLLELAQTRGGDQIVVRKMGEDVKFFGGNSEAREKLNKTKVRVNINTIKDLVNKVNKVIIVGHKNADADCVGAAICMSNIVLSLNKPAYIIYKSGGVDSMINDVINKYYDVILKKHVLVSEDEALQLLDDNTLVIMVDHHSKEQSNGSELLDKAKQIIILDHHRRKAELDVSPMMFYCEPSASSTCEIVCEFLPYMSKKLNITEEEANIMYLGILIDTDRFRERTGARTFDVAKWLKQNGANPAVCDELAEEPYDNIINRSNIISAGKPYRNNVVISALNEGIYNRSIASQACDSMVKAKEIEAAFVICNDAADEVMISARSNGHINVQVILEQMNGGGHMTAAGLQRKDTTVAKVENELLMVLDNYFKGDVKNESNTIE